MISLYKKKNMIPGLGRTGFGRDEIYPDILYIYPLVNVYITMANHHFLWVNPLFLWDHRTIFPGTNSMSTAAAAAAAPKGHLHSRRRAQNCHGGLRRDLLAEMG